MWVVDTDTTDKIPSVSAPRSRMKRISKTTVAVSCQYTPDKSIAPIPISPQLWKSILSEIGQLSFAAPASLVLQNRRQLSQPFWICVAHTPQKYFVVTLWARHKMSDTYRNRSKQTKEKRLSMQLQDSIEHKYNSCLYVKQFCWHKNSASKATGKLLQWKKAETWKTPKIFHSKSRYLLS